MFQEEMEKEKRATQLRWSHQEKAVRAIIDNTINMYGYLRVFSNQLVNIFFSVLVV